MTAPIINLAERRESQLGTALSKPAGTVTSIPVLDTNPNNDQSPSLPPVPETHPISAPFMGQVAFLCSFMVDSISYFGPRLENMPIKTQETKRHLAQLNSTFQALQAAIDAMEAWAHEAMPGHPKPLQAMQTAFVGIMAKQMAKETPITTDIKVNDDDTPPPPLTA